MSNAAMMLPSDGDEPVATHARARLALVADGKREVRIRALMEVMADVEFARGITWHDVAEVWKVNPATARGYTAEASRRLLSVVNPEWVRGRLARALDARLDELGDIPEPARRAQAAAQVAQAFAGIVGANAPAKHEVLVRAAPPGVEQSQWEALQQGDPVALARVNCIGVREALPTLAALPPSEELDVVAEVEQWAAERRVALGGG